MFLTCVCISQCLSPFARTLKLKWVPRRLLHPHSFTLPATFRIFYAIANPFHSHPLNLLNFFLHNYPPIDSTLSITFYICPFCNIIPSHFPVRQQSREWDRNYVYFMHICDHTHIPFYSFRCRFWVSRIIKRGEPRVPKIHKGWKKVYKRNPSQNWQKKKKQVYRFSCYLGRTHLGTKSRF